MKKMFKILLLVLSIQSLQNAKAQTVDSLVSTCGTDTSFLLSSACDTSGNLLHPGVSPILPPAFTPGGGSTITCGGKIDLFFEDIYYSTGEGFDDHTIVTSTLGATLGEVRQATFCKVLNDIQATFNFNLVSPSDHLRILVQRSLSLGYRPIPGGVSWFAGSSFNYTLAPGITGGYFQQYVTTGTDPIAANPSAYHGKIRMNFDRIVVSPFVFPLNYQDDYTLTTNCTNDLYSILIHEMGHIMGFLSFIDPTTTTGAFGSCGQCVFDAVVPAHTGFATYVPGMVTLLDWSIRGSFTKIPGITMHPLATSIGGGAYGADPWAYPAYGNYWLNGSAPPDNYPMYSSGMGSVSFFSHFDDQLNSYTLRDRISPGDHMKSIMGPFTLPGEYKRNYTKADLEAFTNVLGYHYLGTSPITNHLPYSKYMATLGIDGTNFGDFTETLAAEYNDVNNGSTIHIDLSDPQFAGDLSDADAGDAVTIDPTTLVNIRGCGIGGNNHNALTLTSPTHIEYKPRPNFYGRAQIGFNITDGKERGSFRVVTIDVQRGSNVGSVLAGGNYVCNGDFEEGTELMRLGTDETIPFITYSNIEDFGQGHEGKWQGISFSDCHPFAFHASGTTNKNSRGLVVQNSFIDCNGVIQTTPIGSGEISFPFIVTGSAYNNPNPKSGGERYQFFKRGAGESYYLLSDDVLSCKRYRIEFDIYKLNNPDNAGCSLCAADFTIGFTSNISAGLKVTIPPYSFPTTMGSWQHESYDFDVPCFSGPGCNILYLGHPNLNVHIDNLSLTPLPITPISGTIANTGTTGCVSTLTSTITNARCSGVSYSWKPVSSIIGSSTTSSISVHPTTITTYTLVATSNCDGSKVTATIIVDPTVDPITGLTPVCTGASIPLASTSPGGTWSSSVPGIATIVPATGVLTGVGHGTSIIQYTLSTGCSATATATVVAPPLPITGVTDACPGTTSTLADVITGGSWSSSNMAVATVSSTGVVSALVPGTTMITYSNMCGYKTTLYTVHATPPPIGGSTSVCRLSSTTLTNAIAGGTWNSSDMSVATVGLTTGIVTGWHAGTSTILYTTSCGSVSLVITVIPMPVTITSVLPTCPGCTTTPYEPVTGGTWSSSVLTVATVGATSGIVTGVSPGTTILTYSISGCYVTTVMTIDPPLPAITGTMDVCASLGTAGLADAMPGGTWSSSNMSVATINSGGVVTGLIAGTTIITYTVGMCFTTTMVTVHAVPLPITGSTSVCPGATILQNDAISGGTWSVSNSNATINATTGLLTGVTIGTARVTYTLPGGCYVTRVITVTTSPSAITGPTDVCVSSTITLHHTTSGGTWSSSNPGCATVGASTGIVTGITTGTTIITYTLSGGCFVTLLITVNPLPAAIVALAGTICEYGIDIFNDATPGGTWMSSNPSVLSIDIFGIGSGLSAGTAIISYILPTGCMETTLITIDPAPALITGPPAVCAGATVTCADATTGGTWSSSNPLVATIGATTGIVTGVSAGTVIISYTKGACTTIAGMTVYPAVAAITGPTILCTGGTITLNDASTGGIWTSSDASIATVSAITGIVSPTGTATGAVTITYTLLATGCYATYAITVSPPPAAIMGGPMACSLTPLALTDATPSGTWSTTDLTVTLTSGGVVTALSGGTAIISYTAPTGCITTTTLTTVTGSCSPCAAFGGAVFTVLGGTSGIPTSVGAGRYYIDNTVNITSPTTMTGAVIMMGTGAKIIVDPSGTLTVDNSHLFSCGMWPGIEVQSTAMSAGKIKVINHSLIEDADIAISMINPGPAGGSLLIECDDAIFNRNTKGIHIENYPSTAGSYPFLIRNSTFTSRDFSTYSTYPMGWPANASSTGLKFPWTPSSTDVYSAPVNMANPSGSAWYSPANCKNGRSPYCGIWLDRVGAETPSGTLIAARYVPAVYHEIVIGDDAVTTNNDNLNVFDNMQVGICAKTSNVSCLNNLFMNIVADNMPVAWPAGTGVYTTTAPVFYPSGDGIYAGSSLDGGSQKRLQVYSSPGSSYRNSFYGFNNAVESENYYSLYLYNSYMINQTPSLPIWMLPPGYVSGSFGYKLSSSHYHDIAVNSNYIYNVNTAINLWQLYQPLSGPIWGPGSPAPYQQYLGSCDIINNTIAPRPAGSGALTNEGIQKGVVVQNALTSYSMLVGTGWAGGVLSVNNNNIQNAYSGIYVNYNYKQKATSNSNYITLRATGAPGSVGSASLRYGINHTACTGDAIWTNTVTTATGTATTDTSMRGIYCNTNTSVNISCNQTIGTARGFEFVGVSGGAMWHVNDMQNNIRGMTLNGALIGKQGTPTAGCNNRWLGTGWSATNPQTYVWNGADASANTLYVKTATSSPYNPTSNIGFPGIKGYSGSSIIFAPGTGISCPPPLPIGLEGMGEYESMVRQSFLAAASSMPKKWMNQYELWRTLQWDTLLIDSSAAIAQFAVMAQNSRYAYLTNLETQVADGNVDSAMALLALDIDSMANTDTDAVTGVRMADSITTDNIVLNYQDFYRLYIKFMGLTLTTEDSSAILALAQLCPHKDGMVVYQARALYSYIYNDLTMFNDDSCMASDSTYRAEWKQPRQGSITAQDIGGQGYHLYPNPNDGNITLQQMISDTGIVRVEIYDVVGRRVYGNRLQFSGKIAKLHVGDIVPGMYLLQLTGTDEKMFRFKFLKE